MRRTTLLYIAVMTPLSFALLLGGEWIVALLYGRAYSGAGVLVALVALTLLPNGLSIIYSRGLYALGRADIDFRIHLLPLAATIVAGIWLIAPYGLIGAGGAALAGNTAAAAARFLSFRTLAQRHA